MKTIELSLQDGQRCPIRIGSGLLKICGELLKAEMKPCRVMLVTDENVAPLYLDTARKSLAEAGFAVNEIIVPAGEQSKSLTTLERVLEAMAAAHLTRTDLAVSLGGGVIGDLTGFAAGCYLRGIRFVQLPTTFLAAVDASVGGKTAVNLAHGKNLAGLFHQQSAVFCDTDTFSTLGTVQLADGAAEAIKTGILGDTSLFEMFEYGNTQENMTEIVAKSVAYKSKIVAEDPNEHGVRKLLNLGHTAGHAIELASKYEISHGFAVAIGTAMMCRAAVKRRCMEKYEATRILQTLQRNGLPITTEFDAEMLAEIAQTDKKAADTSITVILPKQIGNCQMEKIPLTELKSLFADGMEDSTWM